MPLVRGPEGRIGDWFRRVLHRGDRPQALEPTMPSPEAILLMASIVRKLVRADERVDPRLLKYDWRDVFGSVEKVSDLQPEEENWILNFQQRMDTCRSQSMVGRGGFDRVALMNFTSPFSSPSRKRGLIIAFVDDVPVPLLTPIEIKLGGEKAFRQSETIDMMELFSKLFSRRNREIYILELDKRLQDRIIRIIEGNIKFLDDVFSLGLVFEESADPQRQGWYHLRPRSAVTTSVLPVSSGRTV